jgi:hypothetical protein
MGLKKELKNRIGILERWHRYIFVEEQREELAI